MIWAQLGLELCLGSLALGLAWIAFAGGAWPPPPYAFLPAAVGLASARLFPTTWRRLWWYDWLRWTVALGWAAGCAIYAQRWSGASPVAGWNVAFIAGLLLFWRGWSLGEDGVEPRDVLGTVQMALFAALGLVAVLQLVAPGAGMLPGVGTLLFGLLALGLARRAERRRPGAPPELDWLTLLGVLGIAILVVGGLLLLLVTPDGLVVLWDQARALGLILLSPLFALFGWLGSLFSAPPIGPTPTGFGPGAVPSPRASPAAPVTGGPDWADAVMAILTVLLPILALVWLVYFIGLPLLRRLSVVRPVGASAPVESEPGPPISVVTEFSWRTWWRTLLARLFGIFGGESSDDAAERRRAQSAAAARARADAAGEPEPRTVRELYRTLLTAAAGQGLGRGAATTPNELRRRLSAARPGARRPLDVLTEIYTRTRYGQERPAGAEVEEMRSAVREAVEELKRPPEDEAALRDRLGLAQRSPHPRSPWEGG